MNSKGKPRKKGLAGIDIGKLRRSKTTPKISESPARNRVKEQQLKKFREVIRKQDAIEEKERAAAGPEYLRTVFIIMDDNSLRSSQIRAYISRMGFNRYDLSNDLDQATERIISHVKGGKVNHVAVVTVSDYLEELLNHLKSPQLAYLKDMLPESGKLLVFLAVPLKQNPLFPDNFNPQMIIDMNNSPVYNANKLKNIIEG